MLPANGRVNFTLPFFKKHTTVLILYSEKKK